MKLEMVDVKSEDSLSCDENDDNSTTRSSFGINILQGTVSTSFIPFHSIHPAYRVSTSAPSSVSNSLSRVSFYSKYSVWYFCEAFRSAQWSPSLNVQFSSFLYPFQMIFSMRLSRSQKAVPDEKLPMEILYVKFKIT